MSRPAEEVLEFGRLKEIVGGFSTCAPGRRGVQALVPQQDVAALDGEFTAIAAELQSANVRSATQLRLVMISGLVIASAVAATIWTSNSDAKILRDLSLADFAERQSTVVELNTMTMSDAMRGYLLNPFSQIEFNRHRAAPPPASLPPSVETASK